MDAVRELLASPFAGCFDLSSQPSETVERYGDNGFGRNMRVSRRLLEVGVRDVEVQLPGWDTHVGNFPAVRRLCGTLEPAWLALMDDLKSSGLWEDTLIVWMGEFGRTPVINGQSGRDHYPRSIPVVLAGADIGGRAIGSTGKSGQDPSDAPHRVADLMYTLMTLLGVDPSQEFTTEFGSPTDATNEGQLISGII